MQALVRTPRLRKREFRDRVWWLVGSKRNGNLEAREIETGEGQVTFAQKNSPELPETWEHYVRLGDLFGRVL